MMSQSNFAKLLLESGYLPDLELHSSDRPKQFWAGFKLHSTDRIEQLWVYHRRLALWKPIDDSRLQKIFYNVTTKYIKCHQETEAFRGFSTAHFVREACFALHSMIRSDIPFNSQMDLIPLADQFVFNLKTKELSPRSHYHRFTYSLPVIYDADADPTEIEKFLGEILPDEEDRNLLRQILFECLGNRLPKERIYFWGQCSAGVSTLFRLISATLGPFVIHDRFGRSGHLVAMDEERHRNDSISREHVRMVLVDGDEPEKKLPPTVFQLVRSYSSHSVEEIGIEFTARFSREPAGKERESDPLMSEKICDQKNRNAFLNWILKN